MSRYGSVFIAKTEYSERKARRQPCRITERLLAALGFPKTDPAQLAVNIVLYTLR
jgi:hypothetical protein